MPRPRNEFRSVLPASDDRETMQQCKKSAACALTGATNDVTLDHFIPLEWGHGGEYVGNLFFVAKRLNESKSNMNPFRWIKKLMLTRGVNASRWDALVRDLAAKNGMTPKEFRQYVNWCEKHKRTVADVLRDPRPSIEIWKEGKANRPSNN